MTTIRTDNYVKLCGTCWQEDSNRQSNVNQHISRLSIFKPKSLLIIKQLSFSWAVFHNLKLNCPRKSSTLLGSLSTIPFPKLLPLNRSLGGNNASWTLSWDNFRGAWQLRVNEVLRVAQLKHGPQKTPLFFEGLGLPVLCEVDSF